MCHPKCQKYFHADKRRKKLTIGETESARWIYFPSTSPSAAESEARNQKLTSALCSVSSKFWYWQQHCFYQLKWRKMDPSINPNPKYGFTCTPFCSYIVIGVTVFLSTFVFWPQHSSLPTKYILLHKTPIQSRVTYLNMVKMGAFLKSALLKTGKRKAKEKQSNFPPRKYEQQVS